MVGAQGHILNINYWDVADVGSPGTIFRTYLLIAAKRRKMRKGDKINLGVREFLILN
jgi:hypothetical protein